MPESFVEIRRHRGRGDAPTEAATEVYLRLAPSTVVLEDEFTLVAGEMDTSSGRTVVCVPQVRRTHHRSKKKPREKLNEQHGSLTTLYLDLPEPSVE